MADDHYIIDAAGMLVGRLATRAATAALHGKEVRIINAEQAALSGSKAHIVTAWKRKYLMGAPRKGPYIHRTPDRLVRRIIRGMLPHKTPRGREAYARVLCYIGTPAEFKGKKAESFPNAHVRELPGTKYLTVGQVCKELGGRWYE